MTGELDIMLLTLLNAALAFSVLGQANLCETPIPVYQCFYTPSPVVIDGRLDDPAWLQAAAINLVISTGTKPAAWPTEARMCWDDKYLYAAFKAEDDDIWGTMTERDDDLFREEVVEIFFDPDCNQTHYYEINVNPLEAVFDAFIQNRSGSSVDLAERDWDCRWLRTAVKIDGTLDNRNDTDRCWTTEIAVPFTSVPETSGFPPKPGDTWRINLYRINLTRTQEFTAWSPTTNDIPHFHVPSRFGRVIFIKN